MSVPRPDISVVVPAFNEQELIERVLDDFLRSLDAQRRSFELIVVNDGSRDATGAALDRVAARDARVRVIHFNRNYGQTAALQAGFLAARADVIVALDADGQNDPDDIEMLCDQLDEGCDVVSGWRKNRQDHWLRTFLSRVANRIIGGVTGVHLHDYGCTLKAYRAHMVRDARLFGEMHRFIPVYTTMHGARIRETVVKHHPRTAGTSKYGYGRIVKVALDLLLVRMLQRYRTKPLHFFGKIAQWSWLAAAACFVFAVCNAIYAYNAGLPDWWGAFWGKAPLVGFIMLLLGFTAIMQGLVAEMAMRSAFEHDAGRYWEEARRVGFEQGTTTPVARTASRPVEQVAAAEDGEAYARSGANAED